MSEQKLFKVTVQQSVVWAVLVRATSVENIHQMWEDRDGFTVYRSLNTVNKLEITKVEEHTE